MRSRSLIGSIGAGIQSLFGGNITLFTQLSEKSRSHAFDLLLEHASELGANAIVGARYDATELAAGITEVLAYGTAVVVEKNAFKTISIKLKYQGKKNVIEGLRRISKPGLRHYVGAMEIPRVRGGLGVAVISTPEGVMTDVQARKKNLGGELLCYIW